MRIYVGVTDGDWFSLLRSLPDVDEVNFWQPSGSNQFRALSPGEMFLFKLHSPRNFIVGGGFFGHFSLLPVSLAWAAFSEKNGATTHDQMRQRIAKYRRQSDDRLRDYSIGCILLEQPFFFPEDLWIPVPEDWAPNIVRGKGYDTQEAIGRQLWDDVQARLPATAAVGPTTAEAPAPRYGEPVLVPPRLGQGSFRILVTDAYERRCAVTNERTLPVLQAAHIKPFAEGGEHNLSNGLLLRSDIHILFDQGFVTVTPEHRFEVSRRIREEFENGRDYYALHGKVIHAPPHKDQAPSLEILGWHNNQVFRG